MASFTVNVRELACVVTVNGHLTLMTRSLGFGSFSK